MRRLHPADGAVGGAVYQPGFWIKNAVPHMDTQDLANDKAVIANLEDAPAFALQANGRLRNARRLDAGGGQRGEPCVGQFTFSRRQ